MKFFVDGNKMHSWPFYETIYPVMSMKNVWPDLTVVEQDTT